MKKMIQRQKKTLITYRIEYCAFIATAIITFVLHKMGILVSVVGDNYMPLPAMMMGAAISCIVMAAKVKKTLKDESKLKEQYIVETDERRQLIEKTAAYTSQLIMFPLLLVGASVFVFINATIYYTLMGVLILQLLLQRTCALFYNKKF